MDILLHVVHVLAALSLIGLVLLQHGQGADAGASFGAGSSNTVFGSAGSANFLTRATAVCALVFFLTSMGLAWQARQQANAVDPGLPQAATVDQESEVPATEVPAPAQAPAADSSESVPESDVPSAPAAPESSSDVPAAGVDSPAPTQTPSK